VHQELSPLTIVVVLLLIVAMLVGFVLLVLFTAKEISENHQGVTAPLPTSLLVGSFI